MADLPAKINVLHISQAAGGVETHILHILEHIDKNRFRLNLICPQSNGGLYKRAEELGVHVHAVSMIRRIEPLHDIYSIWAISALMKKIKPDIVHVHSSKAGVLGRLVAALHRVPSVYTPNAFAFLGSTGLKRRFYIFVEKSLRSVTGLLLACGPSEMDRSLKDVQLPTDKVASINNSINCSIDPVQMREKWNKHPIILMVGRFISQKNPEMFVRVAKLTTDALPQVKFILVGGGYQAILGKETEQLIKLLGLIDKVTVMDWMEPSALESLLNNASIVVVPSRFDGLPYLPLEAMLHSKPVVGTNVDGVKDTIVDGETGYLVELDDDKAMANRLIELVRDPDLRRQMGIAGKQRVEEHFNVERNTPKLEAIYERLYQL